MSAVTKNSNTKKYFCRTLSETLQGQSTDIHISGAIIAVHVGPPDTHALSITGMVLTLHFNYLYT